jgi:hypothetical protein
MKLGASLRFHLIRNRIRRAFPAIESRSQITSSSLDNSNSENDHVKTHHIKRPWHDHRMNGTRVFFIPWVYHFLSRLHSLHYRSKNQRFINSQRQMHVHERFGVNERNSGKSKTWYRYELTRILSAWPKVLFRFVPNRARGIQRPRACMAFSCPVSSSISSDQ